MPSALDSDLLIVYFLIKKTIVITAQMHPTTIYAIAKKLFFPPKALAVDKTKYFFP